MFNSAILDVVIGVVVIYLQLSLVCTAFHELVALLLRKRAKELEKGILGLLTAPGLVNKLYDHPLIKGLSPDGRKPSYIPSRTFALSLMDIVRRHSFDGTLTAAEQVVAVKTAAQVNAKAAFDASVTALAAANTVVSAANDALAAAGAADKLAAAKAVQDAANQQAAAATAKSDAEIKLAAANKLKADADSDLTDLRLKVTNAREAESTAQTAEAAANQNSADANLKAAAAAARQTANASADLVDPSATSLLTEARDKVAGVQSDVVPPELKSALLALMDNAGTNLTKAQENVEQWFNDAMDRVSGVYKRKSHVFVVIVAVVITVMANVDTLQVADSLSHDRSLRESLVAAAPELAKADSDLVEKERGTKQTTPTPTPTPAGTVTPAAGTKPSGAATPIPAANSTPTPTTAPTPSLSTIKASLDVLQKFGLPIGYIRVCTPVEEKAVDSCALVAKADAIQKATAAALTTAEATLKTADARSQKADSDLKAADDNLSKATATTKDGLSKARASALAEQTSAQADQKKAQTARDDAKKADDTAQAAKVAADQGAKVKGTDCPKCRKAAELTATELKQILPTTHDHELFSSDFGAAAWALILDSWELLYAHWLGWLLTAFAISLGAPFWFDMLNKLIVVRSTVKPKEKSQDEPSKS